MASRTNQVAGTLYPLSAARAAARMPNEVQRTVPEARVSRAFGASALHDEAVLDIPAYMRRAAATNND